MRRVVALAVDRSDDLGLLETQVDELRTELEYQQRRLDEMRDAALAKEKEWGVDAEEARRQAHEDWANEE